MGGVLFLLLFCIGGAAYSSLLFRDEPLRIRLWLSGVFGVAGAAFIPMLTGLWLGFTFFSNCVALMLWFFPALGIFITLVLHPDPELFRFNMRFMRYSLPMLLGITAVTGFIMWGHYLLPVSGGIASGQSTYGDMAMHISFIEAFVEQSAYPADYCLITGVKLSYPFLTDQLSASMMLFGSSLRLSMLVPGILQTLLTVSGLYLLTYEVTGKHLAANIACMLFFLNGGFGFIYYLDGAAEDVGVFTSIFTDYFNTPSNNTTLNLRWVNTICDMIVPQRTTLIGWCMVLPVMWMGLRLIKKHDFRTALVCGVFTGMMPMMHTHSFFAAGLCLIVWCVSDFIRTDRKEKGRCFLLWLTCGGIALLIAVPQLLYWTLGQVSEGSFLMLHFGWVNEADPELWFWVKNIGLPIVLIVPAAVYACKEHKLAVYLPSLLIFVLAEVVVFQPNVYDNNKLLLVGWMLLSVMIADYASMLWERLRSLPGTTFIAAVAIFVCTLTAFLTIGREIASNGEYTVFSDADIASAEFIKENTEEDAVFATGDQHLNAVTCLAGRDILAGSDVFLYFHGISTAERDAQVQLLYEDPESYNPEDYEYNPDYIYISSNEENKFEIDYDGLAQIAMMIYDEDGISIYKVNE